MPDPDPPDWMLWARHVSPYSVGAWHPRFRGTLQDANVAARVWRQDVPACETVVLPAGVEPVAVEAR